MHSFPSHRMVTTPRNRVSQQLIHINIHPTLPAAGCHIYIPQSGMGLTCLPIGRGLEGWRSSSEASAHMLPCSDLQAETIWGTAGEGASVAQTAAGPLQHQSDTETRWNGAGGETEGNLVQELMCNGLLSEAKWHGQA